MPTVLALGFLEVGRLGAFGLGGGGFPWRTRHGKRARSYSESLVSPHGTFAIIAVATSVSHHVAESVTITRRITETTYKQSKKTLKLKAA